MTDKELDELSEGGLKYVKEISVGGKSAVFVVSFTEFKKSFSALMSMKNSNGKQSMDVDILGAGDRVLHNCFHSGDEEMKTHVKYRTKAAMLLGGWIAEEANDGEEEKKR